jgi:UDP-N-acetylmuramyl pentapeptide synthase
LASAAAEKVAALQTLSPRAWLEMNPRDARRLVVVLGDMLELGDLSPAAHREVGLAVAALGAAEFITKPVDFDALTRLLQIYCGSQAARAQ